MSLKHGTQSGSMYRLVIQTDWGYGKRSVRRNVPTCRARVIELAEQLQAAGGESCWVEIQRAFPAGTWTTVERV